MKRLLDIFLAGLLLIVFLVPMVVIALVVKGGSKGPVVYRAVRVGRQGRVFSMLKFRSMKIEKERGSSIGAAITAGNDSRVTGVGRWLRRWHLDELPQLFHILSGRMSFVGPRPEDPKFVDLESRDWQEILSVRPGLTGPSQLIFRELERSLIQEEDAEEVYRAEILPKKRRCDREYAQSHDLREDFHWLAQTLLVVLGKKSLNAPSMTGASS